MQVSNLFYQKRKKSCQNFSFFIIYYELFPIFLRLLGTEMGFKCFIGGWLRSHTD
jgi:hypothetical protein